MSVAPWNRDGWDDEPEDVHGGGVPMLAAAAGTLAAWAGLVRLIVRAARGWRRRDG